jgi:glycosyltransferase involved in cell wall biosynthesis
LFDLADVLIAPYHPAFGFSMPTKIFDYMAAGRPIISSCPGEARLLIDRFKFGINYSFDKSASVEEALGHLYANEGQRTAMGLAARRLFEEEFNLDSIVRNYTSRLQSIIDRQTATNPRRCSARVDVLLN